MIMGKFKHGHCFSNKRPTPTYNSWRGMMERCYNQNNKRYSRYGARGITVCDEWHEFSNFLQEMGERPEGMTLERKNRDCQYNLSNCCWATPIDQANNTARNHYITHNGVTKTLGQWAQVVGLKRETIARRLKVGWPIDRALNVPVKTLCNCQRKAEAA